MAFRCGGWHWEVEPIDQIQSVKKREKETRGAPYCHYGCGHITMAERGEDVDMEPVYSVKEEL